MMDGYIAFRTQILAVNKQPTIINYHLIVDETFSSRFTSTKYTLIKRVGKFYGTFLQKFQKRVN